MIEKKGGIYMLKKKVCQQLAKNILSEALDNLESVCVFWHHQPELPKGLESMKKDLATRGKRVKN